VDLTFVFGTAFTLCLRCRAETFQLFGCNQKDNIVVVFEGVGGRNGVKRTRRGLNCSQKSNAIKDPAETEALARLSASPEMQKCFKEIGKSKRIY